MRALFLGAGASYECGMPLVWEFTNTLRPNILKRLDGRLFDFRKKPAFRAHFEAILSDPSLHYEQMVGALQDIYLARGENSAIAHDVYRQLVECIQILLLEDQKLTLPLFKEKVKDYIGIKNLVEQHPCVHVFSLNHDINFEEICEYHAVNYRDGFYHNPDKRYAHIARFDVVSKEQLDAGNFNFLNNNEKGVNLIKLHGSLDMFGIEDLSVYIKASPPRGAPFGAHFEEILRVEKHSHEVVANMEARGVNELFVRDESGELQFMRRSLLTGAHKFKGGFEQIAPRALFDEFKKRIHMITELDVIGYGFGDEHVNDVLSTWLASDNAVMNIYDPFRMNTPDFLESNGGKVKIVNGGLSDYFNQYGKPTATISSGLRKLMLDSSRDRLRNKRLAAWAPENDSKATTD
jgi:hypothetical protein